MSQLLIVFKTIILGIIPIVIAFGADTIAQSLKRGELVQSLISDLAQPDAKRDVALIALDAAITKNERCTILWIWRCQNDSENDQVVNIAMALVNTSISDALKKGQSPEELEVAKRIISNRAGTEFYAEKIGKRYRELASNAQRQVISSVQVTPTSPSEIINKANTSQTLAAIQPSSSPNTIESLAGIRLVYIQYQSNRDLAEKLQKDLQSKGVSAPGIEQVDGIEQNNIRYANAADRQIAENLQAYLEKNQGIQIEQLIDLSRASYRVSSGQFEIWLK